MAADWRNREREVTDGSVAKGVLEAEERDDSDAVDVGEATRES